jgi:dihydropteroate synthase
LESTISNMLSDGADIIDIGGESTAPTANPSLPTKSSSASSRP